MRVSGRAVLAVTAAILALSGCTDKGVQPRTDAHTGSYGPDHLAEIQPDYGSDYITGSGSVVALEYEFTGFTEVEALGDFQVTVVRADEYSVKVWSDDNIVEYLEVARDASALHLGLAGESSFSNLNLSARIAMPDLRRVRLDGISQMEISGFDLGHELQLSIGGVGRLSGALSANGLTATLSGISTVALEGQGGDLTAQVSDGGTLDLGQFVCDDAAVDLSGNGKATINLTGTLNGQLTGASVLRYLGTPSLGVLSTSGIARIERAE